MENTWIKYATDEQVKIVRLIESEAIKRQIPPSCTELELIGEGLFNEDWDI